MDDAKPALSVTQQPKADAPWTVGRLLEWTARYLGDKGFESPRLDAEVLLAHALGCRRIELYTRHAEPAPEDGRRRYRELIRRRMEGCPVAYLVGRKEFYSLEFAVGPAVLIPRPDTECLVDECLRLAREIPAPRIVDVGTGSGAIAVAIAKRHGGAVVTATDISPEALTIAAANAVRHAVGDRVRFVLGDLLDAVARERFDFVLSNPPYIAPEDLPGLPVGVRDYEPHRALNGGPGGFEVFDRLVDQARRHLVPGGTLIVEIGAPQEESARARLAAYSDYDLGKTLLDGSGHPRVLRARLRA
jgi:release factor glutamine methyltransferase